MLQHIFVYNLQVSYKLAQSLQIFRMASHKLLDGIEETKSGTIKKAMRDFLILNYFRFTICIDGSKRNFVLFIAQLFTGAK